MQGQRPQDNFRRDQRPQGQQRGGEGANQPRQNNQSYYAPKPQYQKYSDRPSDDPFAKRRENLNRSADGRRPAPMGQNQQRRDIPQAAKPEVKPTVIQPTQNKGVEGQRPAQQALLDKQQKLAKQQAEGGNPFVVENCWHEFIAKTKKSFESMVAKEGSLL